MERTGVQRYHSLDALRAAMMLLGLVLHSAASYMRTPLEPHGPTTIANNERGIRPLVFFIHLFRMPVFFVVAGFFACAAVSPQRRGEFRAQPRHARGASPRAVLGRDDAAARFRVHFLGQSARRPEPWE